MTSPFATVVAVDWSAASSPSPRGPAPAAPWVAVHQGVGPARIVPPSDVTTPTNHRTRASVMACVIDLLQASTGPTLLGWDFGFGYPRGFAAALGRPGWAAVWAMLADRIVDGPDNANNRLHVAADLNDVFDGPGPFWGNVRRPVPDPPEDRLPTRRTGIAYDSAALPFPERRLTETMVRSAQPMFKMAYTGSVGSQSMVGIARLQALRTRLGDRLRVWPFQPLPGRLSADAVVVAEVYPTMFTPAQAHPRAGSAAGVLDANQVLHTADALARLAVDAFETTWMPSWVTEEEGWILGAPRPPAASV